MDKWKVITAIKETGVIAIIRGKKPEEILLTANALYEGGIRVIEVTCNTPGYLKSISLLSEELGDKMSIGAGTVLNPVMAQLVLDAGAIFALAPNLNPEVVQLVHENKKLMIPGVSNPTEMVMAHRLGVDLLKLFPAGSLGTRYLKEIQGPLNNLDIIPVGGINLSNVTEFSKAGAFAVGVGSDLVDSEAIAAGNFSVLTERAQGFIRKFKEGKSY